MLNGLALNDEMLKDFKAQAEALGDDNKQYITELLDLLGKLSSVAGDWVGSKIVLGLSSSKQIKLKDFFNLQAEFNEKLGKFMEWFITVSYYSVGEALKFGDKIGIDLPELKYDKNSTEQTYVYKIFKSLSDSERDNSEQYCINAVAFWNSHHTEKIQITTDKDGNKQASMGSLILAVTNYLLGGFTTGLLVAFFLQALYKTNQQVAEVVQQKITEEEKWFRNGGKLLQEYKSLVQSLNDEISQGVIDFNTSKELGEDQLFKINRSSSYSIMQEKSRTIGTVAKRIYESTNAEDDKKYQNVFKNFVKINEIEGRVIESFIIVQSSISSSFNMTSEDVSFYIQKQNEIENGIERLERRFHKIEEDGKREKERAERKRQKEAEKIKESFKDSEKVMHDLIVSRLPDENDLPSEPIDPESTGIIDRDLQWRVIGKNLKPIDGKHDYLQDIKDRQEKFKNSYYEKYIKNPADLVAYAKSFKDEAEKLGLSYSDDLYTYEKEALNEAYRLLRTKDRDYAQQVYMAEVNKWDSERINEIEKEKERQARLYQRLYDQNRKASGIDNISTTLERTGKKIERERNNDLKLFTKLDKLFDKEIKNNDKEVKEQQEYENNQKVGWWFTNTYKDYYANVKDYESELRRVAGLKVNSDGHFVRVNRSESPSRVRERTDSNGNTYMSRINRRSFSSMEEKYFWNRADNLSESFKKWATKPERRAEKRKTRKTSAETQKIRDLKKQIKAYEKQTKSYTKQTKAYNKNINKINKDIDNYLYQITGINVNKPLNNQNFNANIDKLNRKRLKKGEIDFYRIQDKQGVNGKKFTEIKPKIHKRWLKKWKRYDIIKLYEQGRWIICYKTIQTLLKLTVQ